MDMDSKILYDIVKENPPQNWGGFFTTHKYYLRILQMENQRRIEVQNESN